MTAVAGIVAGGATLALVPDATLFTAPEPLDAAGAGATGVRWACPMMDFIGHRPGPCPVCGMQMTPVTAGELSREQQRRMGIELARVTTGPAVATVRAHGIVRYDERTLQVVVPRVAGRVVKRHAAALHAGTLVQAGEPVVDLYSPEAFAAQGELAAALKLGEAHTLSALLQRFMRWNLAPLAEAIVAGGAPVDTFPIPSPFAGVVVLDLEGSGMDRGRLPQVGQEIMADTPLLRLVEPRTFMVVLQVPESRAHWVKAGQAVRLSSDDRGALPDVSATVSWISPELDRELRAREVHLHLVDPAQRLLPGSLVEARFEARLGADFNVADAATPPAAFTLVPKAAVLSTGVRHVAWRVAGRDAEGRVRFELAPLALGPRLEDESGQDLYVVRAGLNPGDEVAAQGSFLIDSQAQLAGTPSLLFPAGAAGTSNLRPESPNR